MAKLPKVPKDFPVKVLKPGEPAKDRATCGNCGRSWDDAIGTELTPAPSARCPFEYYHAEEQPPKKPRKNKKWLAQTITITVTGKTEHDLDLALEEAVKSVRKGCVLGFDSNDTGGYHFDVVAN